MKLNIHSQEGVKISSIDVDKYVFGIEPNINVVNQAVNAELSNLRQGTRASKNRSKVRGGGKKPFKQKGRGGARAGTIRSPLWRGGGTVFGPQPHSYSTKMPKKMKNLARRSVLSNHFKNNNIFVLSSVNLEAPSTKQFKKILSDLKIEKNKVSNQSEEDYLEIFKLNKFIEKKFQNTSREISEKNKLKIKQILKKDGKKTK